jgi:hypothetical protein
MRHFFSPPPPTELFLRPIKRVELTSHSHLVLRLKTVYIDLVSLSPAYLQAGWSGVRILVGTRDFSLQNTQTNSLIFNVYWVTFRGINRPGRKVNHSPPSSAEIKMNRAIPLFPYVSMVWTVCHTLYFSWPAPPLKFL